MSQDGQQSRDRCSAKLRGALDLCQEPKRKAEERAKEEAERIESLRPHDMDIINIGQSSCDRKRIRVILVNHQVQGVDQCKRSSTHEALPSDKKTLTAHRLPSVLSGSPERGSRSRGFILRGSREGRA